MKSLVDTLGQWLKHQPAVAAGEQSRIGQLQQQWSVIVGAEWGAQCWPVKVQKAKRGAVTVHQLTLHVQRQNHMRLQAAWPTIQQQVAQFWQLSEPLQCVIKLGDVGHAIQSQVKLQRRRKKNVPEADRASVLANFPSLERLPQSGLQHVLIHLGQLVMGEHQQRQKKTHDKNND